MYNKLVNFIFFLILFFASCISKKKYLHLKGINEIQSQEYEEKNTRLTFINDSLLWVMNQKDLVIDSLSGTLMTIQNKKEKVKPAYTYTNKVNMLTKEQEYNKKALFIYNFTKNVEWPMIYNGTEFIIGVAGDVVVIKQLTALMSGKKAGGKKIIISEYKPGNRYNVVYYSTSSTNSFTTIKDQTKRNKTLLIADEQNLNNTGAHISFIIDKDKVRYIANKPAIEKVGLKVNEELMRFSEKTL